MKINDLIKIAKKATKKDFWIGEDMLSEFQLSYYDLDTDKNNKFYVVGVGMWRCTDTWVGSRIYFLGEDAVAYSYQSARKSNEIIYWMSKDSFHKTRLFLESIRRIEDYEEDNIQLVDESYDFGEGFTVEYYEQLLIKKGKYEGKDVLIVEKHPYKYNDKEPAFDEFGRYKPSLAKIRFENGEELWTEVKNILIEYDVF